MRPPGSRQELERIYERPYRELVPIAWRQSHLPLLTGVTAALVALFAPLTLAVAELSALPLAA